MAIDAPWLGALARMQIFRDALASVALSHPADCRCEVCKAADGDDDAFARLYSRSKESGR